MHLQTEMNELQERMFHLHALINNIPGLIIYQVTRDRKGKMRFTYISDNISQFTGRTADEIIEDSSLFYDLIMKEDRNRIHEAEQASLKAMSSFDMEIRSKNLDGEVRWIHLRSVPRQLNNGTIIWHGIHVDITDRKTAELQLKRSIERFEMIAATTHDAVWEWNVESNELWVNEMHQRLYGLTKKDPIPTEQEWEQRVHPDDKETIIKEFAEFLDSDKAVWSAEYRFLTEEKGYRNIYDRTYIVRNEIGKPIHIIGSMTDITDQKKAEEQFRDLLESAPDAIIIINEWGNIVLINRQTETIFGYRKEELLEQPLEILLPAEYREKHISNREMFFTTPGARAMGEGRELLALHKNGTKFPVEIRLSPLRTEKGLLISAAIRDISERKKVQTRLEESEKKLRHVLSSMANDFYAIDMDYRIVVINQLAEKNLEQSWKMPVKIGTNILEAIPQTEKERFKQNFTKVFNGERIEYEVELGSHKPVSCVHVSISPVKDDNGMITGACVNTIDISERKKAEEKIKQSEERYKALVENAVEALVVLDIKRGKFVAVSESAASLFKMTKEELLQKGPIDLSPEFQPDGKRSSESAKEKLDAAIAGAKPAFEWTHLNSKDETMECEVRLVRLPSEDQLLIRGCIIDISERKKTELELKRSHERYELIGRATNDAIWDWDLKTNERWGNESFYKLYGLVREKDSLNGLVPFERTHPDDIDKIKTALTTAFDQKASYVTEEFRFRMPDDSYKTFLDRAFIQYDEKGNAIRLIGAMQDITERKKAEEAIREFNERFEMIAATTHDAIWEWNLETNELWANEMHQSLYGLTINDPVPLIDEWISRIHPDDVHTTTTSRAKALISNQNAWISEYRFRIGDEYRHLYDRTYVVRNAEGKAIHLMGSMTDITERKKVEEKLQTLNDRYYALMNNIDGIVWEADAKTFEFKFVSKQAERLLGYPVEQWIHEPNFWPNHIFEDDRKATVQYCVQCTAEKRSHEFEYRMVAADGKLIWLRDIVTVQVENDETVMLRGIMVDITERKAAEAEMIREKYLSDSLINSLPGIFYLFDNKGKYLRWNKNMEVITGYTSEKFEKMNPLDFFEGVDKMLIQKSIAEVFDKGKTEVEAYMLTRDNTKTPYYFNAWRIIFEGKPCVIGVGIDISERKKAEQEILMANERFNLIAKATNDFVWDADLSANKMWRNDNYTLQLGWKVDPGKNNITEWEEHIHPEDKERVTNRLRRFLEETKKNIWTEEYRFQKADGSFITVYDRGYIMRDENAKAYRIIGAMTDISAIKETEELLKKSYSDIRRLASHLEKVREEERIEIAREIHDELGQQLTVLKMDISWLNKNLSLKDEKQVQRMTDLMHTIDLTIKNVRKISSQLRPSVLDDLGLVSAIEWLLRDFEKSVGFKTRFISEVGDLSLDAAINTALFRVVQESLTNVTRHAQATEVLTQLKYDGYELIITLMDNGKGFIINSIENKKTLGILGMRERIAKINGTFSINSTPGKGTTIEIRVPVSSKTEPKTLR